ncbi:rubrerythrin [Lamprobacter modestohalophilus]|uniref:Rubrerythrin n=1 Tax=Lamprobacter modestohalophilus TaxID=1064514 RepID=A0A9X1B5Y9_9GAMM|nr:ferritin family protein [Lamprobacter modestohalophilus]MBK1620938.1 rubrerythrin [Lamprobacter modestohalophilus]MCF7980150.1 ferritin family protein [Chromatiaceae bacterium]MCF7995586.1 ferritin family protein [Chromatiaceae bacterium]MCF8017436.1 ferritin family protein [Chromatiaceae bacterium]
MSTESSTESTGPLEGQQSSYERIRSMTTLEDVLSVATSFEESARNFYTDLIPKISKNFRWLAEELAKEEQGHYELFTALAARDDIEDQIKAEVERPATDGKFAEAVMTPDLGEKPDDQAVLQYAMSREHLAMTHYRSLADSSPAGPFKELFEYLANEEAKHKEELEKLYYETVHSGGV